MFDWREGKIHLDPGEDPNGGELGVLRGVMR